MLNIASNPRVSMPVSYTHQKVFLHGTSGCDHSNAHHQILNIAINVLFHPWGPCSHPASNTAELKGVWLMARCIPTLPQLQNKNTIWMVYWDFDKLTDPPLKVLSNDASLHMCSEVLLINPEDTIHLRHVQGDNWALFILGALQSTRHICTTYVVEMQYTILKSDLNFSCLKWNIKHTLLI